jgi:hypothetical protein
VFWSLLLALFVVPSVSIAEPEPRFDHEKFCIAAQDIERRANADQGTWIDEYTRHEGMTVDCETRAVELRLYVHVPFKDIPGNWQDRVHREWSDDYCTDPAWAASIAQRWRIVLTIRSIGSEQFSARADCH